MADDDVDWDGLSYEESALEDARRSNRWWYFHSTTRVRAESEEDARTSIENNQIDIERDGDDGWGPFVRVGELVDVEHVPEIETQRARVVCHCGKGCERCGGTGWVTITGEDVR